MSDFATALKHVGNAIGVSVRRVGQRLNGGWRASLTLPMSLVATVELEDGDHPSPEVVVDAIDAGKRELFHHVIDHIAKHDRSPLDRLKQIEDLARKTLPRWPSEDTGDQRDLRHLLDAKAGSAGWACNGYGEEPKR